jgi:hypothetical protein
MTSVSFDITPFNEGAANLKLLVSKYVAAQSIVHLWQPPSHTSYKGALR